MDKAHIKTDEMLEVMERKLRAVYQRANKEIGDTWKKYLSEIGEEIKDLQTAYDKAKKTGDKDEIRKAGRKLASEKKKKTLYDKYYKASSEQLAEELLHVNEKAIAYVNGELPEVYALNYNYFEETPGLSELQGYSFTLTDAQTVKNLATEDKTLLPYKEVNGKKDIRWNTKVVNSEVLQGILQGETMDEIAERLDKVTNRNMKSAITNARTMVTSAENKGRQDSYIQAEKDGIVLEKEWISTEDGRTRHSHRLLDGKTAKIDKPFKSELGDIRYPGDPEAHPSNIYNCRCTTRAIVKGFRK